MFAQIKQSAVWPGSGIILGLFLSRLFNEVWFYGLPFPFTLQPTLISTILSTLIITTLATLALKSQNTATTWPLFLLAGYLFYPELNPRLALLVLIATLTAVWLATPLSQRLTRHPRLLSLSTLGLALSFFLLYTATLAADVLTADNAEFQLIATNLGVAHPPGFPLYTLLAYAMTRLPLPLTPAAKINLLSAITSTLTLILVYRGLFHLTKRYSAALTAAITLGTATTFWAQATTANIRSLTGLWAALVFYALIRFKTAQEQESQSTTPPLLWAVFGLSFGIAHHASLVFMGIPLVIFALLVDPTLLKTPRRWLRPFFISLLSLLPLLYIPWRASLGAERAPERLATWTGFLNHILARGFRGDFFYFTAPADLWERLKIMGHVMTFQFNPLLLVGMGLGLLLMLKQARQLAWLCGGTFAIHTLITATYRAPQTVEYMLPAYIPAVLCLGYAIGQTKQVTHHLLTAVWLTAALYQGWQHYPDYRSLHQDTHPRDYAQLLLDNAPPHSTILAHWHWATPLWYLQEVEGQRPDVSVQFVFPTAEPYPQTWARRVQEALTSGRDVLTTHYDQQAYTSLPPPQPIGDSFLFRQEAVTRLPAVFMPLDLWLGDTLHLIGYQPPTHPVEIGEEAVLTLAWRTPATPPPSLTLFTHLVGFDGTIYAQEDRPLTTSDAAGHTITFTQFRLTPRLGTLPGDLSVMVGAYTTEASDLTPLGEPRTPIDTLTVTAMVQRPFSQNPTYRPQVDGSRTLTGYDWDHTLADQPPRLYLHWHTNEGYITEVSDRPAAAVTLPPIMGAWGHPRAHTLPYDPTHYVPFGEGIVWTGPLLPQAAVLLPGQTQPLYQTFHSSGPIERDIATATRLVGYEADGYTWAWWDLDDAFGIPAMGGMPTLKWIRNSAVYDPHRLIISPSAYPGQQVGALLSLYDTFTNRPIPTLDERFTPETPWRITTIGYPP